MGRFVDITGKHFGNWTVIHKTDSRNSSGNVMWLCQCECGNTKVVSGISLRKGLSKSCGCIHREKVSIDLRGKHFGDLDVISDTGRRDKKGNIIWLCKCKCGSYTGVSSKHLMQHSVQSCGCASHPYKNITGMRFHNLVALAPTNKRSGSAKVWKCICDCGNICEVSSANLQNGHTKSCGCLSSYGESVISKILESNNIIFEKQKMFDSCRFPETNTMTKFDFYIDNRFLLEYDGNYHFYCSNRQWNTAENFENTQKRDKYKFVYHTTFYIALH